MRCQNARKIILARRIFCAVERWCVGDSLGCILRRRCTGGERSTHEARDAATEQPQFVHAIDRDVDERRAFVVDAVDTVRSKDGSFRADGRVRVDVALHGSEATSLAIARQEAAFFSSRGTRAMPLFATTHRRSIGECVRSRDGAGPELVSAAGGRVGARAARGFERRRERRVWQLSIRVAARVVDAIVLFVCELVGGFLSVLFSVFPALMMGTRPAAHDDGDRILLMLTIGWFLSWIAYHTIAEAFGGATIGKWICDLRVIGDQQRNCSARAAIVRTLAFFLDAFLFGYVAKSFMDGSHRKERLGDRWAGTAVAVARTLRSPSRPALPCLLATFSAVAIFHVRGLDRVSVTART